MKRVSLVLLTLAAGVVAAGCVGPTRSPNPLGHASPNKDLATQEQYPIKSSAVKEEKTVGIDMGNVGGSYPVGPDALGQDFEHALLAHR